MLYLFQSWVRLRRVVYGNSFLYDIIWYDMHSFWDCSRWGWRQYSPIWKLNFKTWMYFRLPLWNLKFSLFKFQASNCLSLTDHNLPSHFHVAGHPLITLSKHPHSARCPRVTISWHPHAAWCPLITHSKHSHTAWRPLKVEIWTAQLFNLNSRFTLDIWVDLIRPNPWLKKGGHIWIYIFYINWISRPNPWLK